MSKPKDNNSKPKDNNNNKGRFRGKGRRTADNRTKRPDDRSLVVMLILVNRTTLVLISWVR